MDQMVFIGLLALLGCVFVVIGMRTKSSTADLAEFFLGGRKLGVFSLAMTLLATQLGGGTLLGAAEEAYRGGWLVLCYPLGYVVAFLILSCGFGARLRRLELFTLAEVFERGYGSSSLRKVGSLFSIVSLFLILIALGIAMRKFLLALGFTSPWYCLGIWTVVIGYTAMGGLKAVVKTDVIQAACIVVMMLVGAIVTFWQVDFNALQAAPIMASEEIKLPWVGWLLMPMLFMLIEQDMAQRYFAARSASLVPKASMLAALLLFIASATAIAYGVLARDLGVLVPEGASVLMTVIQATTSPVMVSVMACAVLLAIISTADSLLCSISSNLAMDFFSNKQEGNTRKNVKVAQIATAATGLLAVSLSYGFDSVLGVMLQAYELSVFALLWPVVFVVLRGRGSVLAASGSIAFGLVSAWLFRWVEIPLLPREISSLLFSLTGYLAGDWIAAVRSPRAAAEASN